LETKLRGFTENEVRHIWKMNLISSCDCWKESMDLEDIQRHRIQEQIQVKKEKGKHGTLRYQYIVLYG
jgi:hypothetical protein